jgi:hypothetical protein
MTDLVPMVRDSYTSSIVRTCYDHGEHLSSVTSRLSIVSMCRVGALCHSRSSQSSSVLVDSAWQRHDEIAYHPPEDGYLRSSFTGSVRASTRSFTDVRKRSAAGSFTACSQFLPEGTHNRLRAPFELVWGQRPANGRLSRPSIGAGTWYRQGHSRPTDALDAESVHVRSKASRSIPSDPDSVLCRDPTRVR